MRSQKRFSLSEQVHETIRERRGGGGVSVHARTCGYSMLGLFCPSARRKFVQASPQRNRPTQLRLDALDNPRRRPRTRLTQLLPDNQSQWLPSAGMSWEMLRQHGRCRCRGRGRGLTSVQSWFLRKQAQDDSRSPCVRTLFLPVRIDCDAQQHARKCTCARPHIYTYITHIHICTHTRGLRLMDAQRSRHELLRQLGRP